jgi:cell division protein FtsN
MAIRREAGGTLLGVLIGLVIGVLISLGVVWYLNKMPIPFQDKTHYAERAATGDPAGSPVALPGKPGDKADDKPRFEFYKILPGETSASKGEGKPEAKTEAKVDAKAGAKPAGEPMFLQAGAFQKPTDADNLKAKLALMGVEASVQEAEVADKGKMFRVRVGPFATMEEMNRARTQLSQDGVPTNPVKGN